MGLAQLLKTSYSMHIYHILKFWLWCMALGRTIPEFSSENRNSIDFAILVFQHLGTYWYHSITFFWIDLQTSYFQGRQIKPKYIFWSFQKIHIWPPGGAVNFVYIYTNLEFKASAVPLTIFFIKQKLILGSKLNF